MRIFLTILLQIFFLTQTFAITDESIIIELQNNCGKKVELSLELANNPLNLSLENGLKSKFKLKIGSYIVVNKIKIYQIVKSDEGKAIRLCK